jgi:hypothetical protein
LSHYITLYITLAICSADIPAGRSVLAPSRRGTYAWIAATSPEVAADVEPNRPLERFAPVLRGELAVREMLNRMGTEHRAQARDERCSPQTLRFSQSRLTGTHSQHRPAWRRCSRLSRCATGHPGLAPASRHRFGDHRDCLVCLPSLGHPLPPVKPVLPVLTSLRFRLFIESVIN